MLSISVVMPQAALVVRRDLFFFRVPHWLVIPIKSTIKIRILKLFHTLNSLSISTPLLLLHWLVTDLVLCWRGVALLTDHGDTPWMLCNDKGRKADKSLPEFFEPQMFVQDIPLPHVVVVVFPYTPPQQRTSWDSGDPEASSVTIGARVPET